jgi:DNA-binding NarL/FixJ family response regulator
MWERTYGPIPKGMQVLHRCDNPKCVRLVHLFLGTPKDNMQDKIRKSRHNPTKGVRNARHKLFDSDVRAIKDIARLGLSQREIAELYHINQSTVSRVLTGFCWSHVDA